MNNFVRLILFVIFFSIGSAVLAAAVLVPDLVRYYQYRQVLHSAEKSVEELELLNEKYDTLLKNIEEDPNLLSRVAPVIMGSDFNEPNAVYPEATAEELEFVRQALQDLQPKDPNEVVVPGWLGRCSQSNMRLAMFLCGAALVLVSLTCFGPAQNNDESILPGQTIED